MLLSKKETVTNKEIMLDVKSVIKSEKKLSEAERRKEKIILAVIGILICITAFIRPLAAGILCLLMIVAVPLYLLAVSTIRKHRSKNADITDHDITTGILSSISDETYTTTERTTHGHRETVTVTNYYLHFENGKSWHIPETNYDWSEDHKMSPSFIYENSHRGDEFILVQNKRTGEIVMAYDTEFFQYEDK